MRFHNVLIFPALGKEKICESSPIELIVSPFGQWSLTQPRDRADLQPPLPIDNPIMIPALAAATPPTAHAHHFGASASDAGAGDEDKWLSQVEILTHFGPHRRLWMGPQFAFKTFQQAPSSAGGGGAGGCSSVDELSEELLDLDISLPNRPEQSNPVRREKSWPPLCSLSNHQTLSGPDRSEFGEQL